MTFYKDCGITDAAVSQWRKGKTKPAMTTISRIADYLCVPVSYLLDEGEKEKSPTPEGAELFPGYSDLTGEEKQKVRDYISLLLAARQKQ